MRATVLLGQRREVWCLVSGQSRSGAGGQKRPLDGQVSPSLLGLHMMGTQLLLAPAATVPPCCCLVSALVTLTMSTFLKLELCGKLVPDASELVPSPQQLCSMTLTEYSDHPG